MKVDLLKQLQENELYRAALQNAPEEERKKIALQIEGMMFELSQVAQEFADRLHGADEKTICEYRAVLGEHDLVIGESHTSGSLG